MLFDNAGAERYRRQRYLDAVGVIGIADGKLKRASIAVIAARFTSEGEQGYSVVQCSRLTWSANR